jgi:hypothetical protein
LLLARSLVNTQVFFLPVVTTPQTLLTGVGPNDVIDQPRRVTRATASPSAIVAHTFLADVPAMSCTEVPTCPGTRTRRQCPPAKRYSRGRRAEDLPPAQAVPPRSATTAFNAVSRTAIVLNTRQCGPVARGWSASDGVADAIVTGTAVRSIAKHAEAAAASAAAALINR